MSKNSKKLKIRFATFAIAKYGGIVGHIEAKFKALQDMGHDVDIIILDYLTSVPANQFQNKVAKLESGTFQDSLDIKSQNGGYVKSEITGYWTNPYYGWVLEPNRNRISCLNEDSLEVWHELVDDADIILWSFIPTKTSEAKGFNWWHKYFDLPSNVSQILSIHDGYYDQRNSWTNLLKDKIKFLECVHITSFNACSVFDIPRVLNLDSRFIDTKFKDVRKNKKQIDFFSAHIFKSMKRMEDLVSAVPYINSDQILVAGSGIELYYMMTENKEKQKPKYTVSKKTDPNCEDSDIGKSLWERAVEYDMSYLGLIGNTEVNEILAISKFAIDPSFCTHYAKYVNTHLNGFIIEAMINGSYPILRNYRKDEVENDFVFQNINAIFIPYDSTPKEFAEHLNKALEMPEEKYYEDLKENFKFAKNFLNPNKNMEYIINTVTSDNKESLTLGKSTAKINSDARKVMVDFFKYDDTMITDIIK